MMLFSRRRRNYAHVVTAPSLWTFAVIHFVAIQLGLSADTQHRRDTLGPEQTTTTASTLPSEPVTFPFTIPTAGGPEPTITYFPSGTLTVVLPSQASSAPTSASSTSPASPESTSMSSTSSSPPSAPAQNPPLDGAARYSLSDAPALTTLAPCLPPCLGPTPLLSAVCLPAAESGGILPNDCACLSAPLRVLELITACVSSACSRTGGSPTGGVSTSATTSTAATTTIATTVTITPPPSSDPDGELAVDLAAATSLYQSYCLAKYGGEAIASAISRERSSSSPTTSATRVPSEGTASSGGSGGGGSSAGSATTATAQRSAAGRLRGRSIPSFGTELSRSARRVFSPPWLLLVAFALPIMAW